MSTLVPSDFKILLLGDANVGKSTIRKQYMGQKVDEEYLMTMGTQFSSKKITINDLSVKLQIWDVAGQKLFAKFRPKYYGDTSGILLVYDLTNKDSFQRIPLWIKEYLSTSDNQLVPIIIVGNKLDLVEDERILNPEAVNIKIQNMKDWVKRLNSSNELEYFEISALEDINVKELFDKIAKLMIKTELSKNRLE